MKNKISLGNQTFPKRLYTCDEVLLAKSLIDMGYRHRLHIIGSKNFKKKVKEAIVLLKKVDFYDFLQKYIRTIQKIDGLSQLREAQASIWINSNVLEEKVEAACFFVHKTNQMKNYIEGNDYYGHKGEIKAVDAQKKFIQKLLNQSNDEYIKQACEKRLTAWKDSIFL